MTLSKYFEDSASVGILTVATSGVIFTPYFKEKLDFTIYEQLLTYYVHIQSPYNEGATLLLNLKYDVLEGNYECLSGVRTSHVLDCLNYEENFKKMHKTVLTLWYQPYTLSVFVGFSLLDKWSAVKKRPNMTCQKLPLAHKAKMPKKEKELLETIHYFDVSHTTFSRVQLLCEKY